MALTHSPCVSLLAWPHRVKYDAAVTMSPIIAELGGAASPGILMCIDTNVIKMSRVRVS